MLSAALLAICMGCQSDPMGPDVQTPAPGPKALATVVCTVDVQQSSTQCVVVRDTSARRRGPSLNVIPQELVEVELGTQSYTHSTLKYRLQVRVKNTSDHWDLGSSATTFSDIKVFIPVNPLGYQGRAPGDTTPAWSQLIPSMIVGGPQTVTASNPDGVMNFTGPNQPYWTYPEILSPGQETGWREWEFTLQPTVSHFYFAASVFATEQQPPALTPPPDLDFAFPSDTIEWPLTPPNPAGRTYRTVADLRLDDTATDATLAALLAKYQAEVIGGIPIAAVYTIRFPDPGPGEAPLWALLDSLRAEPGVKSVTSIGREAPIILNSVYPMDGTDLEHADWVARGGLTGAYDAIRAPQAWGCETGVYTPSRVKVGVMDFIFSFDNQEFSLSTTHVYENNGSYNYPISGDGVRSHGGSVASLISARGDNQRGAAGMVWGSDLYAFPFARESFNSPMNRVHDPLRHFVYVVLPRLKQQNVRLLVSTMFFGHRNKGDFAVLETELKSYLDGPGGSLFFLAAGNGYADTERATFDVIANQNSETNNSLTAAAVRLFHSGYQDRIVIVGGSQPEVGGSGVTRWVNSPNGSNSFSGIEVVAPASYLPVVRHPNETGGPLVNNGTSLATPLVAGIAAQLWAMSPSLTAAEVKDYIVRGSREPRRDPQTGQMVTPSAASAFTHASPYQVDAYSSLSLLSREHAGTPICGLTLDVNMNGNLVLGRSTPETLTLPNNTVQNGQQVSVAPGGRKIAYSYDTSTPFSPAFGVREIDQLGTVLNDLPGVRRRRYLERDTVDYTEPPGSSSSWAAARYQVTLRRKNGNVVGPLNLYPIVSPGEQTGQGATTDFLTAENVVLSPDGEWAYVQHTSYNGDCLTNPGQKGTHRAALVRISDMSVTMLHTLSAGDVAFCSTPGVTGATLYGNHGTWTGRSDRLIYATPLYDVPTTGPASGVRTKLTTVVVGGGNTSVTISGRAISLPVVTPDEAALVTMESNDPNGWRWEPWPTECKMVTRALTNPVTVLAEASRELDFCEFTSNPTNAPQQLRAPVSGSALRTGAPVQLPRAGGTAASRTFRR